MNEKQDSFTFPLYEKCKYKWNNNELRMSRYLKWEICKYRKQARKEKGKKERQTEYMLCGNEHDDLSYRYGLQTISSANSHVSFFLCFRDTHFACAWTNNSKHTWGRLCVQVIQLPCMSSLTFPVCDFIENFFDTLLCL
jgi:hypothetical protein